MLTLDSNYVIKRRGDIYQNNDSVLYGLYLPLIGYKAAFIYSLLIRDYFFKNRENKISYLLIKSGMSFSDFVQNKKTLESLKLIHTLESDDGFVFLIESLLTPSEFFNDPVLKGLYVNKVGKEEATRMMGKFELDKIDFSKYTDVSAKIKDSFEINFEKEDVNLNESKDFGVVNKNIAEKDFNNTKLIDFVIKNSRIDIKEISDDEFNRIHNLGSLYGLNEEIMGYILIDSFNDNNEVGSKINFDYCEKRCKTEITKFRTFNKKQDATILNSKTIDAYELNRYETMNPIEFLKERNFGVEPSRSDMSIVDYLALNVGFNHGVINAILDFSLKRCNDKLVKGYVEKIADTVVRKGYKTSVEVYDYLKQFIKSTEASRLNDLLKDDEKTMSDEDFEKLL